MEDFDVNMENFDVNHVMEYTKALVGKKEEEVFLFSGTRFVPMDDELVLYYLFNKVLGRTLPITDVIKEIDLYEHDPNEIPRADFRQGDKGNATFYFTKVEHIYSTSGGKCIKRETKGGYWKETDKEKKVTCGNDKVVIGYKTSMLFKKTGAEAPTGSISPFVMHEYRLNPSIVPVDVLNDTIRQQIESLVVCEIVNKEMARRII